MNIANVSYILLILGVIMISIGGYLDIISNKNDKEETFLYLSKYHYWTDGLALILISIFLILINFNNKFHAITNFLK
jgi:hypothetical protein